MSHETTKSGENSERRRGPAKTTVVLKEAILLAAENVGDELEGEGLVSYLRHVARTDVKSFSTLLGKVLPMQLTGEDGGPIITRIELVPLTSGDS